MHRLADWEQTGFVSFIDNDIYYIYHKYEPMTSSLEAARL